jgi:hypothetical protein
MICVERKENMLMSKSRSKTGRGTELALTKRSSGAPPGLKRTNVGNSGPQFSAAANLSREHFCRICVHRGLSCRLTVSLPAVPG